MGRIYLPADDLASFKVSVRDFQETRFPSGYAGFWRRKPIALANITPLPAT